MTDRDVWAHSGSRPNPGQWHLLVEHLRAVSKLAARSAAAFDAGELAGRLGLLHDVGKASQSWQQGLAAAAKTGTPVGLDHKALGTRWALECGLGGFASAVFGHHSGLVDTPNLRDAVRDRLAKDPAAAVDAEKTISALLPELAGLPVVPIPPAWSENHLVGEVGARMVFSALCDADFLDTAAHFEGFPGPRLRAASDFSHLRDHFEAERTRMLAERPKTPMDLVREAVYRSCVDRAAEPQGVFRLGVPTGYAKTLAAVGFGLHHAAKHGLRRVVMAVPFLTITEQNAKVLRGLLDGAEAEPVVLEHHSGVDLDRAGPVPGWARTAAENWDAPVVVTTFVRLFESLMGRTPSAVRRLHRLAGSVIVLDEVQALPHRLLVPILDVLRTLVEHFGVTVVLSSATQPDFGHLSPFRDLPATDLVPDLDKLPPGRAPTRFVWRTATPMLLSEVAEEAAEQGSALVVVNTTANARAVCEVWRTAQDADTVWHLSTRMCPDHRRRVLETVRARLKAELPVLLVSTQLIEAGVDVDFPVVWRAWAPADSLLQAAGRADRDGRRAEPGQVVVFRAADGGQPPGYRLLTDTTGVFFGPDRATPDDPEALTAYYRSVYQSLALEDSQHLGHLIQHARSRWEFQTVSQGPIVDGHRDRSQAFRLIDSDGIAVVTPQAATTVDTRDGLDAAIERVRGRPTMADLRLLQDYTTTLHPGVLQRPGAAAWLRPILGEMGVGGLCEWTGDYDQSTGISVDTEVERFVL